MVLCGGFRCCSGGRKSGEANSSACPDLVLIKANHCQRTAFIDVRVILLSSFHSTRETLIPGTEIMAALKTLSSVGADDSAALVWLRGLGLAPPSLLIYGRPYCAQRERPLFWLLLQLIVAAAVIHNGAVAFMSGTTVLPPWLSRTHHHKNDSVTYLCLSLGANDYRLWQGGVDAEAD